VSEGEGGRAAVTRRLSSLLGLINGVGIGVWPPYGMSGLRAVGATAGRFEIG